MPGEDGRGCAQAPGEQIEEDLQRPCPGRVQVLPTGCESRAEELGFVLWARKTFVVAKSGDCPCHRDMLMALALCADENWEMRLQPTR